MMNGCGGLGSFLLLLPPPHHTRTRISSSSSRGGERLLVRFPADMEDTVETAGIVDPIDSFLGNVPKHEPSGFQHPIPQILIGNL